MNKPYVGVTGPVTNNEIDALLTIFEDAGFNPARSHIPMIGVLVSHHTLKNPSEPHPTNTRFPRFNNVPALLERVDKKAFTTIHFNTSPERKEYLAEDVSRILNEQDMYKRGICEGIQLNVVWPDPRQVRKIKEEFPDLKIILQLSNKAMGKDPPSVIARQVENYPTPEYILIDPSGGTGREFNIGRSVGIYERLRKASPRSVVGFAGGFSGENVRRVIKEIDSHTSGQYSIDAEGKLRDKAEGFIPEGHVKDWLNVAKTKKYVIEAEKALVI